MHSHQSQGQERRRDPRLEKSVALKISSGDFDIVTETKNLSGSGALCFVDKFITPMTKLKLNFLLPIKRNKKIVNKRITCEGVVVRSEAVEGKELFQTAIFFSDISPKDSQAIHEFVELTMLSHGTSSN